jgi:3',5'-cyclic AMP phosphodiesterase CpdA
MIAYGDTRTGHSVHQSIVDSMMTFNPGVVFHSGDLVNNGNIAAEWDIFNNITRRMRSHAEFFPALGNHEHQSPLYFENFDLPNNEQWYSVDRYNTHFIILNSCVAVGDTSEQYRWLQEDLAAVDDSIKFIAAVFHHPPYSTGQHTEDEMGLRDSWVPLFEQYGVDVVFNGHDHDYERSYCGGIYYIVTGGGGAPLRDQAREHPCSQLFIKTYHFCKLVIVGEVMYVKVYDAGKNVIDEFKVVSEPRPLVMH